MPRYICRVEVRNEGAIGIFESRTYTLEADSLDAAREKVFELAHKNKLETRGISVREMPTEKWCHHCDKEFQNYNKGFCPDCGRTLSDFRIFDKETD
jgi:Zn finger protein HypA/HybF involved in hydrogenase expression